MCRLFGLCAGSEPVTATFWLLEAPDSLRAQSHREPDGTGLGYFDASGRPIVEKQPLAAYEDRAFAREARTTHSTAFVSHVRFASTGALGCATPIPSSRTAGCSLITGSSRTSRRSSDSSDRRGRW